MAATSLDLLKCHNCSDGYVCPACSGRQLCPKCGEKVVNTGRTDLEEMADKLLITCKHGCKKMLPPDKINFHQEHCDFKKHVCLSVVGPKGCSWSGTREEMTQHLLSKHSAITKNDFKHQFVIENFNTVKEFSSTVLLTHFSHLFVAKLKYIKYSGSKSALYGGVQFVSGGPPIAPRFRYEFEVGKQTENEVAHYKFMYSRQVHTISEENSDHILSDKCDQFCCTEDIGRFFTDINGTLTVMVILKGVQSLAMKNAAATITYGFVPSQYCQRCVSSFNPSPPR